MTDESTTSSTTKRGTGSRGTGAGLFAAVVAAIAASLCCLGPLVLVSLGATGAWIGNLSALEPYRPLFMAATAGFLVLAFFRVYRAEPAACEPGSACERPATKRATKASLWLAMCVVIGLFAAPYVVGRLAASTDEAAPVTTDSVTLTVDGMTCDTCPATVKKSLTRLDGVVGARVSFDPPQAVVEFDPTKLTAKDLVEATAAVGYPSHTAD